MQHLCLACSSACAPSSRERSRSGLSFKGSYSQTKPKEPVYGGHASAMGPAPAPCPRPTTRRPRPSLRGGGRASDADLLRRADQRPHPGVGVRRRRAPRLRRRRPSRHLSRHGGGAHADARAHRRTATPSIATSAGGSSRTSRSRRAWTRRRGATASAPATIDGDGRLDLYVTNWGPNVLFRNRGDGTFEDVAARAGVAAGGWSTGCTFFDADADGDLDLYVARYVETTWDAVVRRASGRSSGATGRASWSARPGCPESPTCSSRTSARDGFTEATDAHGLADPARAYGFGVVATDYDDDGFVDLFVANDSNPNFLYRNLGTRTIRERRAARRRGGERRGPRAGRNGRRRGRLRRRRADGPRAHGLRPR